MHVVPNAQSPSKFTKFGHPSDPNRPPGRAQIVQKSVPGGVRSRQEVPSGPKERQESAQKLARSLPGALQEWPGAPQEYPKEA